MSRFQEQQFGAQFLSEVIAFVCEYCDPEDVYTDDDLKRWVAARYLIDEVYRVDDVVEYIRLNYALDEIFTEEEIAEYVRDHYSPEDLA